MNSLILEIIQYTSSAVSTRVMCEFNCTLCLLLDATTACSAWKFAEMSYQASDWAKKSRKEYLLAAAWSLTNISQIWSRFSSFTLKKQSQFLSRVLQNDPNTLLGFFSKNEIFRIKEFFLRSNNVKKPDFSVMKKIREFFWGLWTQFFFFVLFSESLMGVDYNFPFDVFSWISSFPRKFHSQNMLNVNHVSKNKIYMMCGLQMVSNYTNLH